MSRQSVAVVAFDRISPFHLSVPCLVFGQECYDPCAQAFDLRSLLIWAAGFLAYRALMRVDLPVGSTLPDMAITIALCRLVNPAGKSGQRKSFSK